MSLKCAVRIVNVDFYMSHPVPDFDILYSEFRGSSISQVPVIRIFGSTDSGKKICLHVHGFFPYLYIPYDGAEDANILKYQIAANIDKAVNISFGQASSNSHHVYKISLVSGIPFYGYHARQHQFFKICLYNPILVRKVSNMLQSEVILGRLYQPHESHIPYILQFMIDYNLHGMSKILLTDLKYREKSVQKQSFCELEADTHCDNILNRLEVSEGNLGVNPGIAALWEDEKQRLRNEGEDSEIGNCLTLINSQTEPTKSHLVFKRALSEKLAISEVSESESQNISVYPSETPSDGNLSFASSLDHSLSSLNDSIDLNSTLVEEAKDLFDILQDLGKQNLEKNEDCDSILSQIPKEEEENEDFLDLSISMAETTPFKNIVDEDDLDTTLIAQLDGQNDSDEKHKKSTQNSKKKYSALPISVLSSNKNTEITNRNFCNTVEHVKRKLSFQGNVDLTIVEEKIECQLKNENCEKIANISQTEKIQNFESLRENNAKPIFTTAELYDLQTNFKAKEGCSTKLTQDSKISETYDLETNFNATKLTQDSKISEIYDLETNFNATKLTQDSKKSSESIFSTPNTDFDSQLSDIGENPKTRILAPLLKPPSREEVQKSLQKYKLPQILYQKPFYSNSSDVTGSVEVGHSVLKIASKNTAHLEECKTTFDGINTFRKNKTPPNFKWSYENLKKLKLTYCSNNSCFIKPAEQPPKPSQVKEWLKTRHQTKKKKVEPKLAKIIIPTSPDHDASDIELTLSPNTPEKTNSCQISGTSLDNTYGFKQTPENLQNAKAVNIHQNITILSVEVHVDTRGDLRPDPEYDAVKAVIYSINEDTKEPQQVSGVIGVNLRLGEVKKTISVQSEEEIFEELIKLVKKWDPDILVGYEVELLSWGFLFSRSSVLGKDLLTSLSRIQEKTRSYADEGLKVSGRILLDVWRLMRHEISLQSYTFESITYHLLHKRVPFYSFKDLTGWFKSDIFRHRTLYYYLFRVEGVLQILEQLDLIGRTSELARLFGIQFYEVLSRGSQFRVESMMLRLAKPLNFIPVSPSVQQRAKMKAPEFLPLILEPESKLYVDPVIVLDFQSLYPSIIIAYNYCFSTCVGKVLNLGKNGPFEFGATQLKISRQRVKKLLDSDSLNFSPCGVAFVKKQVRDGILPKMLREILETRLMVKNSMKKNKNDKILKKVLHNRQLGLKLIANVTYGYTAANFSGRMPAVELGDSVVSKGRETLQRAIEMVENTPEWGARVVYGDTDSLFVMVPGKSRDEAFKIGKKIADAVTNANPDPVKLKLEKVYQPCILQTKKRYVGYMYESADQEEPVYEAKGIETVRRDGCPAVSKMLEKCLRMLFETMDVSLVKSYVLRQFDKIVMGRVSLQDLTFAKEYRGSGGYRPGACVPALELTKKWTAIDRRNEPRRGERVPYVIVSGPPGVPLIRLVRSPRDFLQDPSLRPNSIYYISKVIIPPINRCFNLIGADLMVWFNQMPRKHFQFLRNPSPVKKSTISQYFASNSCACCGEQSQKILCDKCLLSKQKTVVVLHEKIRVWEQAFCGISLICQSCTGFDSNVCISLDCPVLYKFNQTSRDLEQAAYVRSVIDSLGCEPKLDF